MHEFFKEYYSVISHSIEFLAALTGVLYYKKFKFTVAKYLIFFLIYAFLVDLIGSYPEYLYNLDLYYLIEGTLIEINYWWFTIFWFFGIVTFISFINYNILKKNIYKKTVKYVFYIYTSLFLIYCIVNFEKVFLMLDPFLMTLSLWAIFVCVCVYLVEILQSTKIIYFYKSIYFYINAAFLFWILLLGPMVFYEIYFSTADWSYIILKYQIYLGVNVLFYLTLTIAIICCEPETI
ncbi:hypothetical protein ITJ86_08570 [Winogradskyella sp. F6397]|uniref:Uncharacterized protein n=1 Tax=Winogradskyella marina TaxID=2785530 RepID=A0ABS0EHM4_9FLAO|nr:hypothetical protein [Winogradskyella marina]MBF8149950.1 hypothetical protein [Winogradskyella marina]